MGCQIPPYYITAYALAVKHGFKGTEAEWLESLTPRLRIGQVEALRIEEEARVSIGGTLEEPVFDFGIPCLDTGINNQPIGIASHVEGKDNIAGAKGYRVLSITPAGTNAGYNRYRILVDDARLEEKAAEVYAHADPVQWDAKQHHYGKLKIVGLSAGADGSQIIVEQTAKEEIDWGLDADPAENYIYVVGKNFGEVLPANVGIHAEGLDNIVTGKAGHTEGHDNKTIGNYGHTEGRGNTAHYNAHGEGKNTQALGDYTHTEGHTTKATGYGAHAEGLWGTASGKGSHTEGIGTLATDEAQHAGGKYNAPVSGPWVIGNGGDAGRSNAAQMDWDGNVRFDGDVIAFGCNGKPGISLRSLVIPERLYVSDEQELNTALSQMLESMEDGSVRTFEVLRTKYVDEDFSGWADKNTAISDIPVTSAANAGQWNGAKVPAEWKQVYMSGSVVIQPHIEADGNVCLKMTPDAAGGRMQIAYTLPASVYEKLTDGGSYKVSAKYKGIGANFEAQMEAKAAATWTVVPFALTDGEWVKCEHEFTVDKSHGSLVLTFGIYWPGGTQGALYIDDICLEKVVDTALFDGKPAIGQLYRADKNNAAARFTTYGSAGSCLYDKALYAGAWLPMKYSDGTDPDHSHDGYALLDHNHDGSYLTKSTTSADIGAMSRIAETYPYTSGDDDETRFNSWLDGLLAKMSAGGVLPIRFSIYPAVSGTTYSGFLYNHSQGYAEVLATTYGSEILHKYRSGNVNGWQPIARMGLINGTPASSGHNHDDKYYQPAGATVLTNQNWNQYISTSGGGSAGMVREFDSGYLYQDEVKCHTFSYNSNLSKFYTIMISNDTDYSETGTTDDLYPLSGSVSATTVDYMAIANVIAARKSLNCTEECEVWIPTSGSSVKVTITISGTTVTFKVDSTKCRFVNICGYY